MKNQADAGKGSKQRPTNFESYSEGWDYIFNKTSFGIEESKNSEDKEIEKPKSD